MINIDTAISHMRSLGNLSYSMGGSRTGTDGTADCSGAVYAALNSAGGKYAIGTTDSLFGDLEATGWTQVSQAIYGDIFIWGERGASSGAAGHTGFFLNNTDIIHVTRYRHWDPADGSGGLSVGDNEATGRGYAGNPPLTIYRQNGATPNPPQDADDKNNTADNFNNSGEIELSSYLNNVLEIKGWHFSKDSQQEKLLIINAFDDTVIMTVNIELKNREDLAEKYPDVAKIETSGIDIKVELSTLKPFYLKFVNGNNELDFPLGIFAPHSKTRQTIGTDYSKSCDFRVEIYEKNSKTKFIEIKSILGSLSWSNTFNEVPSTSIEIPIKYADKVAGHNDIKIIVGNKIFHGIISNFTLDKTNESIKLDIDHVISEWEFRQIPENHTIKNKIIPSFQSESPFLYSDDWFIQYDSEAQKAEIDYAYSRQNRLEALNKTVELTDNLYWRVGFRYERFLEIGAFGENKDYILSKKGNTKWHIKIIEFEEVATKLDNVFNVLTVYGEKSDASQATTTLREPFLDQQRTGDIVKGFPIVILNENVNNEQKEYYTSITKIASNNALEYAVLDVESIAIESGRLIEKTLSLNDLAPFPNDGEKVTDEDRAKAPMIAYKSAVKQLKNARRSEEIKVKVGYMPADIMPLDKVFLDYQNDVILFEKCSRHSKRIYKADDYFYIISIDTDFDSNLVETNVLTLSKEIVRNEGST